MKIRVGKLKKLIVEAVDGGEPAGGSVELTTNPEKAHAAWPEVTYAGRNIIDEIYPLTQVFEQQMKDKDWDVQEVYLGYIRAQDAFIIGWDVWPPDDRYGDPVGMISAYQIFRVETKPRMYAFPVGKLEECGAGFYSSKDDDGGYKVIHEEIPDVLDLRLD